MAKKFLDCDGVLYFWQKIKAVFVTDVTYNSTNKKIQKTKAGSASDIVTLATVATSGSYNDLSNKPTIPSGVEKTATTPKMDGTATIGSEVKYAAGDHVHPTDTTRAPLASPTFTGTPTAPTPTASTDNIQIATTAFVHDVVDALDAEHISIKSATASAIEDGFGMSPDNTDEALYIIGTMGLSSNMLGTAGGVCPLDANRKVEAQYLPSYVDDVIEAYPRSGQTELSSTWLATGSASGTVITPEAGKIYVLMADSTSYATNTQFRWGGTTYVKLNDGGVTSITNAEIDTIIAS